MKKILLFIITIIILISGIFIFKSNDNIDAEEIETVEKKSETKIKNDTKIKVDIKGYVLNPNVYEVDEDARIIDQTTLNMIQDISSIIARKPMIIGEI